jgi:hypothetical protein
MLWLRSTERSIAIKREKNTCQICGKKGSAAKEREVKIEVHHKNTIVDWEKVIDSIYKEILCDPIHLEVICKECHKKYHG